MLPWLVLSVGQFEQPQLTLYWEKAHDRKHSCDARRRLDCAVYNINSTAMGSTVSTVSPHKDWGGVQRAEGADRTGKCGSLSIHWSQSDWCAVSNRQSRWVLGVLWRFFFTFACYETCSQICCRRNQTTTMSEDPYTLCQNCSAKQGSTGLSLNT